jgi:uncharacterized membrane-anchored protein YjiN (DUF445 family)
MSESKSEFDPDVLKRSLPPDVHAIIDQVKTNVDAAVDQIVNEFKEEAKKAVAEFQNQNYSDDLKAAIQQHTDRLQSDLKEMDGNVAAMRAAAEKAVKLSQQVESSELRKAVADLVQQSSDLQTKLKDFKEKTTTFGEKVGGAIATAAVKTFTGGIA